MFLASQPVQTAEGVDWAALKKDLADIVGDEEAINPGVDGYPGALGGGGYVAPMLVRLAWHSAGSYSCPAMNGGSNGDTIRYSPEIDRGCNAGLKHALPLLQPIKDKYPGASWADIIILAGCVSIEEMGGPDIPFRPGRTDIKAPADPKADPRNSPDGRLPDADKGGIPETAQHLRDIFYRMGFNDREIVALSGAHALGHVHTDRSGYWGPWTRAPNCFSNEYYRLLFEDTWTVKKTHNGGEWKGPLQFESADKSLMMLPSDICIIKDPEFKKYAAMYKDDEDLFFADFAKAFVKLVELGVKFPSDKKASGGTSTLGVIATGAFAVGAALTMK